VETTGVQSSYVILVKGERVHTKLIDLSQRYPDLTSPFTVTPKSGIPNGLRATIVDSNKLRILGTPTGKGARCTTGKWEIQDSSTPTKKRVISWNFYVSGSRFRAGVQLKDGADVLPPGASAITKTVIVDSGAPWTTLSRTDAKVFKLLKANDSDNGFAIGSTRIGGLAGNQLSANLSKPFSILAKGKRADGKDQDLIFKAVPNLQIVYPKRNNPDTKFSVLGTAFINRMQTHSLTLDPSGHASFFDPLLKPPKPPKKPKKCGRVVPTTPESRKSNPGGEGRRLINAELNGILAAFYVVTGSPHTVISESLAGQIGLEPIGLVDMNEEDPLSAGILFVDGFFENAEPGKLWLAVVEPFAIPAIDPGPDGIVYTSDDASVMIEFKDAPVLINPFGVDQNVLGTNLLFLDGESSTTLDFEADLIGFGCDERLLPPSFLSLLLDMWGPERVTGGDISTHKEMLSKLIDEAKLDEERRKELHELIEGLPDKIPEVGMPLDKLESLLVELLLEAYDQYLIDDNTLDGAIVEVESWTDVVPEDKLDQILQCIQGLWQP